MTGILLIIFTVIAALYDYRTAAVLFGCACICSEISLVRREIKKWITMKN